MSQSGLTITLYGRPGCHLCDDVEQSIRRIGEKIPLVLDVIDIHGDTALLEKYMFTIPVVAINGEEVFVSVHAVVTEQELWQECERRSRETR